MNAIIKLILSGLVFLSLALSTGCNSKRPVLTPSENPPTPPPELIITVQMVFDEAAKGVTNTDLDKLKSFYDQVIKDTDQANKLSVLKDTNKEYFIHKLLLLPATEVTKNILSHYTTHLSNAPNAINPSDANKQPLALLTDPARSVSGDQPIERQEMIKILADQGDATTIAAADADAVKMVLDAVLTKGDKNLMVKVLDGANVADPVIKTATFSWVFSKKADAIAGSADTVETAFLATINTKTVATIQDLVDEAAKGPIGPGGADLAKLAIIYNLTVKGDASGNKAAILAGTAASTATADRFPNYLANLAPDAGLLAIWTDYLKQINTHGVNGAAGTAAVSNQVLLPGVGATPLNIVLSKPDSPQRNQIVQEMISRDRAGIAASVAVGDIAEFLTALRQEETQANFWLSFKALISNPTSAKRSAAATWASTNSAQTISKEGTAPTIAAALAALIDLKMIVDDTANAATPIPVLKFLYDTKIAVDVTGAQAAALAAQVPTGVSADRFANFLAKRTPDADLLAVWQDYLAKIAAHAGGAAVTAQVNLVGAGVKPITEVLTKPDSPHRNQIVKEMVSLNRAGIAASLDLGGVNEFLTALRKEDSQVNLLASFAIIVNNPAKKATALAWALTNKAQTIDKEAAPLPTIQASLTAAPGLITPLIVVDQAEAAVASNAQLPLLKFLYEVGIKPDATGAQAAALAAQAPTSAIADLFANYLAKLTPDAELLAIWKDYLTLIATHAVSGGAVDGGAAAVTAQVNLVGAGGVKPIESVLGKADTADRNKIVKEMVSLNRAGIAASVGAVDVVNFLTALRKEESKANFLTSFAAALGAQKNAALTWAFTNKDQTIDKEAAAPLPTIQASLTAAPGLITPLIVVDQAEAAVTTPAELPLLKFLYEVGIKTDVTGAKAALLAPQPSSAAPPVADRFANYLAKLDPDADLLAIWQDYLTQIATHAGAVPGAAEAAVTAQVNHLGTGGIKAITSVLGKADTADRNKIVKEMVSRNRAGIAAIVGAVDLPNFLTALRQEETQADFLTCFTAALGPQKETCITWALANKGRKIDKEVGAPAVKAALAGVFTTQMVVDEAAKGAGADSGKLALLYESAVRVDADADALAKLASGVSTDLFANYLAKLTPDADILAIWTDYFTRINNHAGGAGAGAGAAAVSAQIKLVDSTGGAASTPLNQVVAQANTPQRNKIIKLMLTQDNTVPSSVGTANLANFLDALLAEESQVNFTTAFTALYADPANKVDALAWAVTNKAAALSDGTTTKTALDVVFTAKMVVDEAAKGALANIVELKQLYDFVVNSPADANTLATQAATGGGADLFANYLAKLTPDAYLLAIWQHYLTKIAAHAGAGAGAAEAAVVTQVNLTGAGVKPITSVLGQADTTNRNQIVKEMVKLNPAVIAASVDATDIDNFLTALRKVESAANFTTAFKAIADPADPAKQTAAFAWAMANRTKEINGSGAANEVLTAVRDSARVTTQTLKAEVVASARNWKKVLFYVQVLAHDNNSAKNVANIKTGSKPKDAIPLHKLIVAKSQTVESVQALKHYLSFLTAAEWQSIRDHQTGKEKRTPATIITNVSHPDNADLGTAAHPINDALLIFQDNTGGKQPNPPLADPIADQAP